MKSHDAQMANIGAEQEKKVPFGIKAAKVGLEVLVIAGSTFALIKYGHNAAEYMNNVMGAPPELTNVVDTRRGDLAVYAGYIAALTATLCAIEYGARKLYNKLRK